MKLRGAICAALLLTAVSVNAAYDGAIKLETTGGYGNANGGGVFNFKVTSGLGGLITDATGHFSSFCLEYNEHIDWGSTYNVSINPNGRAVKGGTSTFDAISEGTAWLYSHFRTGTLTGYNNNALSANALQAAIWWLEQEPNGSDGTGYGVGTYQNLAGIFLQEARTALGLGSNAAMQAKDATSNEFGVVVLNLFTSNGGLAQDQLGLVPEPATLIAGALLLLPFGASTIRILRRKQAV